MGYRENQRRFENESRKNERGIVIPTPANPTTRLHLASSPCEWLSHYFPHRYSRWTPVRRRMVDEILFRLRNGGDKAIAAPRGDGKTSIAEGVIGLYAIAEGLVRFPVIFSATGPDAQRILRNIKLEYETAERFIEDYPELCAPVVALEGANQRCGMQTDARTGERTRMVWSGDWVVFPTVLLNWCPSCLVEGVGYGERWKCPECSTEFDEWQSPSAGAAFATRGLDAAVRGLRIGAMRPDFAHIDDPETAESARSIKQKADRERLIEQDIGGLAGSDKSLPRLMLTTIQTPDSLSAKYTTKREKPSWAGERIPQVERWPTRKDLWERYIEIRQDGQRSESDPMGRAATAFYLENRDEMDKDVVVTNPYRFNGDIAEDGDPREISAIQHVHNQAADKGWDFIFCEYQNDPPDSAGADGIPAVVNIASRHNMAARWSVPPGASTCTAFIDVGKDVLWYCVTAWDESFGGHVMSYGTFPEQRRHYFTSQELSKTIGQWYAEQTGRTDSDEAMIYAAMDTCSSQLADKVLLGPHGERYELERIGVDSGWGEHTETVYSLCRQSVLRGRLVPCKGFGVGAKNTPMHLRKLQSGERRGLNWIYRIPHGGQTRLMEFDTNYWKNFVHSRLSIPLGGRGALMLWGDRTTDHRMFADHMHAENRIDVTANGRRVIEYVHKPTKPDNHWLDCVVGCAMLANVAGVKTEAERSTPVVSRRQYGVLSKKANG